MGMIRLVKNSRPGEPLSLQNIGVVRHGVGDTENAAAWIWTPVRETYRLKGIAGGIQRRVAVEIPGDYRDFFEDTWSRNPSGIKGLAESSERRMV